MVNHKYFFFKDEKWAKSKELADKRKVKASTTTVMIKRMEKAGLVERKQDEKDQRVSRIFDRQRFRNM